MTGGSRDRSTPVTVALALCALAGCARTGEPRDAPREPIAGTRLVTHNADSSDTLGARAIAEAAPSGFGLDGAGVRAGVWDGAHARQTHLDLRGRVRLRDVGGYAQHATHTTGTLAGDGRGDASARGMAPAAQVWAYDWLLDLAELEEAAPALSVSSHAYGPALGWSVERECPEHPTWRGAPGAHEDAAFGRYDATAAQLDAIALRTELLMVVPAGNERADVGPAPDGPHHHLGSCSDLFTDLHASELTLQRDTLGSMAVAKNVLTVGAARALDRDALAAERIVPLEVSSFGPTDDARVKPQLLAPGDGLLSTAAHADDAYTTASGTSSATAATAGAVALLTQLHRQLNQGSDPRAAELVALLVHTARDAGEPGPEPGSGYGLLDARAAAELLAADADARAGGEGRQLIVARVGAGETLELRGQGPLVEGEPVRVTLAWTDPPAAPTSGTLDDPTPVLVDDLDLSLTTPDGRVHAPWSLDPTTGRPRRDRDNHADNLEVVDVDDPRGDTPLLVSVRAPATLRRARSRTFALVSSVPLAPPAQPMLGLPRYVDVVRAPDATRAQASVQVSAPLATTPSFAASALEPWLAVSPSEGTAPAEIAIELDLDALGDTREAIGHVLVEGETGDDPRLIAVVLQEPACEPDCEGRSCGADPRCGLACGTCQPTESCDAGGRCVPAVANCPNTDLGSALGVAFAQAWPSGPGSERGACMADSAGESSFRWRAPEAGRYAISARGAARDAVLYARDDGCRGEELACDHDGSGIGSAIGVTLGAGEPLTVFVDTFDDGAGQPIALSIERASCPDASLGSRLGQGVATGTTSGTLGFLAGSCGGEGSDEARFAWTAPYSGTFRFALFDPRYQAVLHLRDGGCDGDELGCSVATDVGPIDVALDAGQRVAVIVDGRDGRSGPFALDVLDADASCAGACGGIGAGGGCACDAACVAAGDCCVDACEVCGACRCQRSCDGARCGPDGCGGECGHCGEGLACEDGACVIDPCEGVRCDACERCDGGRCVALAEGAACEDGDACSVLDACSEGACRGVARDCDDGDDCTLDRCDADEGRCVSRPSLECCDGGPGCGSASLPDAGVPMPEAIAGDGCACALVGGRAAGAPRSALSWAAILGALLVLLRTRTRNRPARRRSGATAPGGHLR